MNRLVEVRFLEGALDGANVTLPLRRAPPRRLWVTPTAHGNPPALELHAWQLWLAPRVDGYAYALEESGPLCATYRAAWDRVPQNSA